MRSNVSTLAFKSNLQPIKKQFILEDDEFCSKVHDPFALTMLKKKHRLSSLQEDEYNYASVHCAYAYKDDYPWGTIIDKNGNERVVCKCINKDCEYFYKCRPDFDSSELEVLKANEQEEPKINILSEESITENKNIEIVNIEKERASVVLVDGNEDGYCHAIKIDEGTTDTRDTKKNIPPIVPTPIKIVQENKQVSFESFVEVTQNTIIEDESKQRTVVNAGPGTGKTWTLIEKIIYMVNVLKVSSENILVLCFSKSAVEIIRKRLREAFYDNKIGYEWQDVEIRTFDSFATMLLVWSKEEFPEFWKVNSNLATYDYDQRISKAKEIMESKTDILDSYEHIIVDEVQDLVGIRAELVLTMLENLTEECGFTILGDACQSLYDYAGKDNPKTMLSVDFYNKIFKVFNNANYYTLTENHRQTNALSLLSIPYRKAILLGDGKEQAHIAKNLIAEFFSIDNTLDSFDHDIVEKYSHGHSLGILTRTNGQALRISSWFRANQINHCLQRRNDENLFGDWIGRFFMDYENKTINEQDFVSNYCNMFKECSDKEAREKWSALIDTIKDNKSRYEVEDIFKSLLEYAKVDILYNSNEKNTDITISTIHRAKGREYDNVIITEDLLENVSDEEIDVDEHKICYVALTRCRENIIVAPYKKEFIQVLKNSTRRCYKTSYSRRKAKKLHLSDFEVGKQIDFDFSTFASNSDVQEYVKNNINQDTMFLLKKCPDDGSYVKYKLVSEDNPGLVLAYTTEKFAKDMEEAIVNAVFDGKRPPDDFQVYYNVYPIMLSDIYMDRVITNISGVNSSLKGSRQYGDMCVWLGISVAGFAKAKYSL